MKTIFINCMNGVSGDMVLNAMMGLCEGSDGVLERVEGLEKQIHHLSHKIEHSEDHAHEGGGGHSHRSYRTVVDIIRGLDLGAKATQIGENIYSVIASAESAVHGEGLDKLHFHEVGRDRAIANVMGVALCLEELDAEEIICSVINDGCGTVECAHGTLDVPVPAVRAMLQYCDLEYRQTDHEGEMVTPSGLAMLIGIGAVTGSIPEGDPVKASEARGTRSVQGAGLKALLFSFD